MVIVNTIISLITYVLIYAEIPLDNQEVLFSREGEFMISPIESSDISAGTPDIAFDQTNYLVIWGRYSDAVQSSSIQGARVTQTGVIIDTVPIYIAGVGWNSGFAGKTIDFDGDKYLVVYAVGNYSGPYPHYVIRGKYLSRDGAIIPPSVNWQFDAKDPDVIFGLHNFIVCHNWTNHHIYGCRVDSSGVILDPSGIAISTAGYQEYPSVACDGNNYFVVWQDYRNGNNYDIYGARVTYSGVLLDTNGIAISTAPANQSRPDVAFDGLNYLVVWTDYRIFGARVTTNGVLLDTSAIVISASAGSQPAVAFNGINYLVADSSNGDIYGTTIDTAGTIIEEFPVSLQSGTQSNPAIAHGAGSQMLITYTGWYGDTVNQYRTWGKFYPFTGIEEEKSVKNSRTESPKLSVYPNPFTNLTTISFETKQSARSIELKLYDVAGRLVKQFNHLTNYQSPVLWSGEDDVGRKLPPGVYLIELDVGQHSEVTKVVHLK